MFAVIKTGGKQYRVAAADQFTVERLPGEAGDSVTFAEVLMVGTSVGAPFVAGASVTAEIVEQTRGPKLISFKKRRRQNSKRTRGHRQDLSLIRIGEILTDGKTASEKPAAKAKADEKAAGTGGDTASEDAASARPKAARRKSAPGVIDIDGIGQVFEKRLAEHGVTSLEAIAAWTDADIDAIDEKADLQGQPRADDWVGQAKALLAGGSKPDRAKK